MSDILNIEAACFFFLSSYRCYDGYVAWSFPIVLLGSYLYLSYIYIIYKYLFFKYSFFQMCYINTILHSYTQIFITFTNTYSVKPLKYLL